MTDAQTVNKRLDPAVPVQGGPLKVWPRNYNQGDVKAIAESIRTNGFFGTIVAQESTGYILAGNHTFQAANLEQAVRGGGYFGVSEIRHFNGGLFDDDSALPLSVEQIDDLLAAARLDWSEVEPAIIGTLFENSLEKDVRKKRGAHYTGVQDILRIVEPVIMQPLRREWEAVKAEAEAQAQKRGGKRKALETVQAFRERLGAVRVLDPACGSGNFLVVALTLLLDLDQEAARVVWNAPIEADFVKSISDVIAKTFCQVS